MRVFQAKSEKSVQAKITPVRQLKRTTACQICCLSFLAFMDKFLSLDQLQTNGELRKRDPVSLRTIYFRIKSFGLFLHRLHLVHFLTSGYWWL